MTGNNELFRLSATAMARAVARAEVSARELCEAHLARILDEARGIVSAALNGN